MREWTLAHPYMTFMGYCVLIQAVAIVINRIFRTMNIWMRGWPPPHLDADGDWRQDK